MDGQIPWYAWLKATVNKIYNALLGIVYDRTFYYNTLDFNTIAEKTNSEIIDSIWSLWGVLFEYDVNDDPVTMYTSVDSLKDVILTDGTIISENIQDPSDVVVYDTTKTTGSWHFKVKTDEETSTQYIYDNYNTKISSIVNLFTINVLRTLIEDSNFPLGCWFKCNYYENLYIYTSELNKLTIDDILVL